MHCMEWIALVINPSLLLLSRPSLSDHLIECRRFPQQFTHCPLSKRSISHPRLSYLANLTHGRRGHPHLFPSSRFMSRPRATNHSLHKESERAKRDKEGSCHTWCHVCTRGGKGVRNCPKFAHTHYRFGGQRGKGSQNPQILWMSHMRAPNANAKEDLWRQIQFSATDGGDAILTGGGGVALLAFLESGESLRMNVRGEERRGVSVCAVALLVSRCRGPTFRMHIDPNNALVVRPSVVSGLLRIDFGNVKSPKSDT